MVLSMVNVGSVKSKSADFLEFAFSSRADIVTLVESWLTPEDSVAWRMSVLAGFTLLDQPRNGRMGGRHCDLTQGWHHCQ